MTIKAKFNADGSVAGFWDSEQHDYPSVTDGAIEITKAVYDLLAFDGTKRFINGAVVSLPVALSMLQAAKLAEINAASQTEASALTASYPEFERLSWAAQQAECATWFAAAEADRLSSLVPWCAQCATARGVDLPAFMGLARTNVDAFIAASAAIAGKRQKLATAIYAASDDDAGRAALAAISWGAA